MDVDLWALLSGETPKAIEGMRRLSPREMVSPQMLLLIRAEASDADLLAELHATPGSHSGLACQHPSQSACRGILTACQKSVQCGVGSITLLPVGTAAREDERGVSYWL